MKKKRSDLVRDNKRLKRLLAAQRRKAAAVVKAKPAVLDAKTKRKLPDISDMVLALSAGDRTKITNVSTAMFKPYAPPPGVVPAGNATLAMDEHIKRSSQWATMAMDDQIVIAGGWAGGWGYGGYGAFAEGQAFLGYPYLSELAQRPEYRVISETIATEMTRKGIKVTSTSKSDAAESADAVKSDKIQELEDELKRLGVMEAFSRVCEQDGFFGRAHLYLDFNDAWDNADELKTPVGDGTTQATFAKITKGSFKYVQPVEAVWAYPTNYDSVNPLSRKWYKPDMWFAMGKEVHASRLLPFIGREVPDMLKPAYSFGGLSLSQMAKPYVDNWLRTRQSVSDLLHAFTVWCLGTNLSETLTPGGEQLIRRVQLFNQLRDNKGMMLTDKDTEELKNISVPLGGLSDLQAQSQEHMAAVSRIPLVKLTGISPAGLNASSEGELRTFYDTIHAYQKKFFSPNLDIVFRFAQINLWGAVDPDLGYEYVDLWAMTEKERAEIRKIDADTDAVLVDAGAIDGGEIRTRVAADESSPHAGIDVNKEIVPPGQEDGMGLEGMLPGGAEGVVPGQEDEGTSVRQPQLQQAAE